MSEVVRFQCEVPVTEFLDIDRGRIACGVTGHGPLIVRSHGIGDHRQVYRFLAPELSRAGYRMANTELRGHGEPAWAEHRSPALTWPT